MKRRDLLDASKLLARHKMDVTNMFFLGLAAQYLSEKKADPPETTLGFQAWLDEDIEEDEDADEEADEDAPDTEDDTEGPTEP